MLEWTKIKLQTNKERITTSSWGADTATNMMMMLTTTTAYTWQWRRINRIHCVRKDTCELARETKNERNSQKISVFIFLFSWRFWRHFVYFFSRAYNSYYIQIHLNETIFSCIILFSIFTHCSGLLFCWCCFYFVFVTLLKNGSS